MPGYNISASLASSNTVGANSRGGDKVFNNGLKPSVIISVIAGVLVLAVLFILRK